MEKGQRESNGNANDDSGIMSRELQSVVEQAFKDETKAFEWLLAQLRPVILHVDVPLTINYYWSGFESQEPEEEYYSERGLILADRFRKRYARSGDEGRYEGTRLCLTRSGKLIEIERSGFFSERQNEESYWASTVMDIKPPEAMAEYDLEEVVEKVTVEIEISIERARKRQEHLGERLSKLQQMMEGLA